MELMGGREAFTGTLDSLFLTAPPGQKAYIASNPDQFGYLGQYAHTNEPVHHVIYMYNYARKPWKCQEKVRDVLYSQYHTGPAGLCGNDDTGQMSAWYVMSALGFYPVTHGQDIFVIGTPMFRKVTLKHAKGTLTLLAPAADKDHPYISGVRVNGKKYRRNYFRGKDLFNGDVTVEFTLQDHPDMHWGTRRRDCPPGADGSRRSKK